MRTTLALMALALLPGAQAASLLFDDQSQLTGELSIASSRWAYIEFLGPQPQVDHVSWHLPVASTMLNKTTQFVGYSETPTSGVEGYPHSTTTEAPAPAGQWRLVPRPGASLFVRGTDLTINTT